MSLSLLSVSIDNASSSAIELADLALVWTGAAADLAIIDSDLASDRGLVTAVLLSMMLDRRAAADDVPPSGDPTDRRGWWADEFSVVEGDLIGSRLWLLERAKLTPQTARDADTYTRECVAWMIDDKVVSAVDVTVTTVKQALQIALVLQRPGRDAISFRFAHTWDRLAT